MIFFVLYLLIRVLYIVIGKSKFFDMIGRFYSYEKI